MTNSTTQFLDSILPHKKPIKHLQVSPLLWYKHGVSVGVFYTKSKPIKHLQVSPLLWQTLGASVGVLHIFLNSLTNLQHLVTIHERRNNLVWIVVNTKILVIEVFYDKPQALSFVNVLHEIEKERFGENVTYTICVERFTGTLAGKIKEKSIGI